MEKYDNNNFNLNRSRKPEYSLSENLISEMIRIYGIRCLWLYSEKVNVDHVFRDFSNMKVTQGESVQVTLLPEDMVNWDGDQPFNQFGFYNSHTQNLFISKSELLKLYPDFLTEKGSREKIINSLLIVPSGTILEVTHFDSYNEGINNLWAFADEPSAYKMTVKVYDVNIADDGVHEVKGEVSLSEGSNENPTEIFEYDEDIDTKQIDEFFGSLEVKKEEQDQDADYNPPNSSTGGPFGNLT